MKAADAPTAEAGLSAIPRHVAIIMDGNGRWAAARGLPRLEGHRRGVEALRRTVRASIDLGVEYLTFYSFSSENWRRPAQEVADLMGLLKLFIRRDLATLHDADVRIRVIGARDDLSPDIRVLLDEAETKTRANGGLTLIIAFNYGGRAEIVRAMRRIALGVAEGTISPTAIDENLVSRHLDTAGVPDPDLLIRTSGEQRISNFLLWQIAYTEFVFLDLHWPDFDRAAFEAAIRTYGARERRFGAVSAVESKTG
ncbi:MAG: di-trans,poly-cis-decaprenylcistransferase [Rhizobiales bacterium 65-9]|nr:isoprenyl transferase [Hyphomicrobiales bacterium]OJY35371.1 MAG: di-trans,poly-cis-decaprenylcistransferase [Rhizobiales bacterium 65-9]